MTELDIEVSAGPVRAIPVISPVTGQVLLSGPGRLYGWSLREASFEGPLEAEGSVVAPAAGATIVTLSAVAGGVYQINWQVELSGAAAAADLNNFALFRGGTQLLQSVNAAAAGVYPQEPVQDSNQFGLAYTVKAVGAGTAGVTYAAQISITPGPLLQAIMELRDGNQPLAEISAPQGGVSNQWFGPMGVRYLNQINVNLIQGLLTGDLYAAFTRF